MRRRCEPLFEGDTHEHCGVVYDDMYRLAVCPHYLLAGGDTAGIGPKAKPTREGDTYLPHRRDENGPQ